MTKIFILSFILFFTMSNTSFAQSFESPQIAFNQAANDYVFEGDNKAISTLNRALKEYPNDEKLRALLEKILKDRQQKQQQQQKNNQQNEEQKKDQQSENQKKQEQQQEQSQQKEEQEKKEQKQQQQQQEQQASEKEDGEKKEGDPKSMQQEKSEDSDQEKDKKDIPQIDPSQMEELNISPEKARMILEAMKNNEIQYLQQMQRRPTQRPDSNEPDW